MAGWGRKEGFSVAGWGAGLPAGRWAEMEQLCGKA